MVNFLIVLVAYSAFGVVYYFRYSVIIVHSQALVSCNESQSWFSFYTIAFETLLVFTLAHFSLCRAMQGIDHKIIFLSISILVGFLILFSWCFMFLGPFLLCYHLRSVYQSSLFLLCIFPHLVYRESVFILSRRFITCSIVFHSLLLSTFLV